MTEFPFFARRHDQPRAAARGKLENGVVTDGLGYIALVSKGIGGMAVHLHLQKGYLNPGHVHPDNESFGYVISGRMRMTVADSEAILVPGDGWYHPKGVWHSTEALEVSEAVEVHIPQRRDILERMRLQGEEV
jgi:quercetin dioxygenase-like cupin family protein